MTRAGEATLRLLLAPLEPYRNELLILDRLDKRYGALGDGERADNHEQGGSALAPWPSGAGSYPIGGTDQSIGYVLGPSADYELGIQLGATHVRVGSAIFGHRPRPDTPSAAEA